MDLTGCLLNLEVERRMNSLLPLCKVQNLFCTCLLKMPVGRVWFWLILTAHALTFNREYLFSLEDLAACERPLRVFNLLFHT